MMLAEGGCRRGGGPRGRRRPRLEPHRSGPAGERLAVEVERAAVQPADPGDALGELHLAVAGDTGDTDDLAAPDLEAHVVDGRHPVVAKHHEVTDRDPDGRIAEVPGLAGQVLLRGAGGRAASGAPMPAVTTSVTRVTAASSPTMRVASSAADVSARRSVPTRAVTHDGQGVADGHRLADLVGDEDDAHALVDDRAQRPEQRVDLLWRQVGRGLVEHQHLGAAVEGLEDLHALAQAHRQVGDAGLRVDGQAEALRQLGDAGCRRLEVDRGP